MKATKKTVFTTVMLITAVMLISWDYLNHSNSRLNSMQPSYFNENDELLNAAIPEFISDNAGLPPGLNQAPGAEDVLVKKIPGDNNHLLVMAFYSKENFASPSFSIENGSTIELRDDGKGYDEKAGDGLYTARITTDVMAFRKQAINILQKMKENGYKPMHYIHRVLVYDPDASEDFDTEKFDANEAVSISGLTNALSAGATETTIDKISHNSIFITNLAVVEDSTRTWNFCTQKGNINGPWTFGTLMRQLASPNPSAIVTDAQLSVFVRNWLNTWLSTQVVNGDTVSARALLNTQVLNPWLNKSKNAGAPTGQLDMRFAPFKLTAIVNRFDLRIGTKFSPTGSACGEGRLVFCLIKSDCTTPLPMTLIFEYGINKPATCDAQKAWAQQWFNLKDLTLGSSTYNQALQNITDQFTLCGTNTSKPNQSSLNRVRTNDLTLSPNPKVWEQREFLLDSTGSLKQTTVGQTPADKYNAQVINPEVQRMAAFANQNRNDIINGIDIVPVTWQGFPFLGGSSHILGLPTGNPPNIFHWDGTDSTNKPTFVINNTARFNFSLETCNGCHAGETQTGFTHVDPVLFGTEATLSGFLTGKAGKNGAVDIDNDSTNKLMSVRDAALRPSAANATIRTFNDINRRAQDLKGFVSVTCGSILGISSQLMFQPVNMVH